MMMSTTQRDVYYYVVPREGVYGPATRAQIKSWTMGDNLAGTVCDLGVLSQRQIKDARPISEYRGGVRGTLGLM